MSLNKILGLNDRVLYSPTTSTGTHQYVFIILNFLTNIQSSNQATSGTRHNTRLVTKAPAMKILIMRQAYEEKILTSGRDTNTKS